MQQQVLLSLGGTSGGGTWTTAVSFTPTSSSAGWGGNTMRFRIATPQIMATGTKVRATVQAPSGSALTIGKAYIGLAAASGDAYDFASTPAQLLFSGNPNVTLASGGTAVSDEATFTIDGTTALILSVYFSGTSTISRLASATGWSRYYVGADSAATVNASGYFGPTAEAGLFSLIEVR